MKKKITGIFFLLILSMANAVENSVETIPNSKNIWLRFTGQSECEIDHCAERIPARPLQMALDYLQGNRDKFINDNYIGIIDFRLKSTEKRLFILNIKDGSVDSMLVTHGKNSEIEKATAGNFSNEVGSEKSSIGFFRTASEPYMGKHGESLRLIGLSTTNSNALERGIVIHAADYATESFVQMRGRLGLSQGCPAVSPNKIQLVISKLKGRALLFIYANELEKSQNSL